MSGVYTMSDREPGWYKIRTAGGWTCGVWDGKYWRQRPAGEFFIHEPLTIGSKIFTYDPYEGDINAELRGSV